MTAGESMTEKTYAEPSVVGVESSAPARPARAWPGWLVPLAAIALVILVTGVWLQLTHPFIRHDDWAFTLRKNDPGGQNIFNRNKYEGRWLNWLYWRVLGQRTSIVVASAIFFTSYAAYVWGMVRLLALRRAWQVFLVMFTFMVSGVWIMLIYWPATLSASMIVVAVGVWSLPLARRHRFALAAWMLVFVSLAVLSYPPVTALLLFAVAVTETGASVRRLLALAVWFALSYGFGVLLVYTFNWLAFGQFGVTISVWRKPNPLRSLADLSENLGRAGGQLAQDAVLVGLAGVVGLACIIWAVVDRRTRRPASIVLGATLIAAGVDSALTTVSGVVTGDRGALWLWPAVCIPAALLLNGFRWSRVAGVAALVVIAVVGTVMWRTDLDAHQATRIQYDALVKEGATVSASHPGMRVVKWSPPPERIKTAGNITAVTVTNMMWDQYRIYPQWCTPKECTKIAAAAQKDPSANVLVVDNVVAVRIPRPAPWL
ncbi:hypothetical protein ACWEOW_24555 [Monashia sp. NPDC004114]